MSSNNEICIVSLGVNSKIANHSPSEYKQNYSKGLKRLEESLKSFGYQGDFMLWEEYPSGSPTHEVAPCGYKPFTMFEALQRNYKIVIWIDSSIYAIKDILPLIEIINARGYLFFKEMHSLGEYCKDEVLGDFGVSREESFGLPSIKGGIVGLNFENDLAGKFLTKWKLKALDGSFAGAKWSGVNGWPRTVSQDLRVKGHRHDQTLGSLIALELGLNEWEPLQLMNEYFVVDRNFVRQKNEHYPSLLNRFKLYLKALFK